jgi:hypothetical protein
MPISIVSEFDRKARIGEADEIKLSGIAEVHKRGENMAFDDSIISGTYVVAFREHDQIDPPGDPTNPAVTVQGIVGVGVLTFNGAGLITAGTITINANATSRRAFDTSIPDEIRCSISCSLAALP